MAQVAASTSSRTQARGLQRLLTNLGRLPVRTATNVSRWFDPNFRLERQARTHVRRWLTRERRRSLEAIPGMSATHECELLMFLAATSPTGGHIVEIGSWKGKSTAWLVEGARRRVDRPMVFAIDPHERDSWAGFADTVRRFDLQSLGLKVYQARSNDVGKDWTRPISLAWIDGCHEYDAVREDIDLFVPHVVPGGWVVFDDAAGGRFPGVERAIAERMGTRANFEQVAIIRHLLVFRRKL